MTTTDHAPPADLAARKAIAGQFDGLVRSVLLGTSRALEAAERLSQSWLALPDAPLEIGAVTLSSGGATILQADEESGRWLLPAFMAGLRRLAPRSDLSAGDLLALCEALGRLQPEQGALEAFRLWLWSDGVEGVQCELTTGFAELLETSRIDVQERQRQIEHERVELVATSTASRVAALELQQADRDALLQRTTATLAEAARTLQNAEDPGFSQLRAGCEDESWWARQEVALAFAMPELRGALPAGTMARQLARAAREQVDARLLALIGALTAQDDDFTARLVQGLVEADVGTVLAADAPLDDAEIARLATVAKNKGGLGDQLLQGLLARWLGGVGGAGDAAAEAALATIGAQLARLVECRMPTATRRMDALQSPSSAASLSILPGDGSHPAQGSVRGGLLRGACVCRWNTRSGSGSGSGLRCWLSCGPAW